MLQHGGISCREPETADIKKLHKLSLPWPGENRENMFSLNLGQTVYSLGEFGSIILPKSRSRASPLRNKSYVPSTKFIAKQPRIAALCRQRIIKERGTGEVTSSGFDRMGGSWLYEFSQIAILVHNILFWRS